MSRKQNCIKMNGINAHDSDNLERNQDSQNTLNQSLDTNNTQDTIPTTTNNSIEQKMVDALAPVLGKEATFE